MKTKVIVPAVLGAALLLMVVLLFAGKETPEPPRALPKVDPVEAVIDAVEPPPPAAREMAEVRKPERECLDCHRYANINTNEGVLAANAMCNECHAKADCTRKVDGRTVSLQVTPEEIDGYPHQYVACVQCHADVARSPHRTETGAACDACHSVHGERTAHAPHLRVDCQACHRRGEAVRLDPVDHRVKLAAVDARGNPVDRTDHRLAEADAEEACRKCHRADNGVGAPAAILPAKSVLCILCHPAPLALGHPLFALALLIFIAGVFLTVRFWLQGSVEGEERSMHRKIDLGSEAVWRTIFSRKFFSMLKVFFLDILLQRRILKESVARWSVHSLIYLAILGRFALSLFTGARFWFDPENPVALALMDKNHGFTGFIHDLLGLFILAGIVWVVIRRFVVKPDHVTTEIEDNVAVALIGLLVGFGFIAEGVRITATQIPPEVGIHAFVGYFLSQLFGLSEWNWPRVYPYLWWIHALLGAGFVAYLPFGKMRHMFNTPLTYLIEHVSGVKREKRV